MKKFIDTLKNIWKIEDLRQRILITVLFVAITVSVRKSSFPVLISIVLMHCVSRQRMA